MSEREKNIKKKRDRMRKKKILIAIGRTCPLRERTFVWTHFFYYLMNHVHVVYQGLDY